MDTADRSEVERAAMLGAGSDIDDVADGGGGGSRNGCRSRPRCLLERPSGDIVGLTQNAGVGWTRASSGVPRR